MKTEPKIVAALRVKNEARWIAEVLQSIQPLTSDILVFDDHSTDGTQEIVRDMGAILIPSPFSDVTDESRDKERLLDSARTHSPDYVLAIDGDEILSERAPDEIRAKLALNPAVIGFPIRYLWNDREHYRADGVYGRFQRASMFQMQPQAKFATSHHGCNFHCGNVPANLKGSGATVQAPLLHLGYMHAEDRIRKYEWYNKHDPGNQNEDCYRHMVVGDTFPADSKFVHGGPLKIFSMPVSVIQR